VDTLINPRSSNSTQLFSARLIFAANLIGGFWLGILGYFMVAAFFGWSYLHDKALFRSGGLLALSLLVTGLVGLLALIPGKLLGMWPYAIAIEPGKGIWVYAPPAKFWVPLDELVDIDVYGGGHVQLNRPHGLVAQLYISALYFPDERLVGALRSLIDHRDGVVDTN